MKSMTPDKLTQVSDTWRQMYTSMTMAGRVAPSKEEFDLYDVSGSITTTENVVLPLFGHKKVKGLTKVTGHTI